MTALQPGMTSSSRWARWPVKALQDSHAVTVSLHMFHGWKAERQGMELGVEVCDMVTASPLSTAAQLGSATTNSGPAFTIVASKRVRPQVVQCCS